MGRLITTALATFSAAALAQGIPPMEFKGFRIGETTYAQAHGDPHLNCKTINQPVADYACHAQNETIAGAPANSALFLFYGDRLATVKITFSTSSFQQVKRALEDKYGLGESSHSVVQNRMGASFNNETIVWRGNDASMTLDLRDQKIDQSGLTIKANNAIDEFIRRTRGADKKNANDL